MAVPGNQREGEPSGFRVLIAGGGVAALEALLALRALAGDRVSCMLIAPDATFRHRPLSVTSPFELTAPRSVDLAEVALEHGATFLHDALAGVDPEARKLQTSGGRELEYDALVVAIGAGRTDAVPGALTFRDAADENAFHDLLETLADESTEHLVFAVPGGATWPLGLYELALLTRDWVREHGPERLRITLVTPEGSPLEVFGREAGDVVGEMLAEAEVEFRPNAHPARFADGGLELTDGERIECDRAVSLPKPEVPEISGIPQEHHAGLIPIDRFCGVLTLERVYAAGDATWFPIKQGGLAAQMADSAASAIAELAGAPGDPQVFRPVLRGALLTHSGPRYLRAEVGDVPVSAAARNPLWWPPAKVAGRYLAPYLARRAGYPIDERQLADLEPAAGADAAASDAGHDDIVAMALAYADENAQEREFKRALRWLEVAEDLELYLPREYERKRASWQGLAGEG